MSDQQPSEAFTEAYSEEVSQDEPAEQVEQAEEQHEEPAQPSGPSAEDFNNPNSDYWADQAKSKGWSEDFEGDQASGKFQKTPREFVKDGDMYNQLHALKRDQAQMKADFGSKLEMQGNMQREAHKAKLEELEIMRGEAIDEADRSKADALQGQIDTVRGQIVEPVAAPAPQAGQVAPEIRQWEMSNPWINDINDPSAPNFAKAHYADQQYNQAVQRGFSGAQLVAVIDKAVKQQFPTRNASRQNAPAAESGGRPAQRGTRALSYDQLSRGEQRQVDQAVGNNMFTKDEAVAKMNEYRKEG